MIYPSFLEAARNGKHTPWRYIAGTLLILFIWLVIGSMASAILIAFFAVLGNLNLQDMAQLTSDLTAIGRLPYYLILSGSFIIFFVGIWLTVVLVHRRPLRTLVTGAPRINWRRIWLGGGIWVLLAVAASLVEYLIWPETFSIRFDWRAFLPFLLFAIILTPIQTTSEELFFRGYLVQGGSLISRNAIFLSLWSGILFTIPHLANPEVAANLVLVSLTYFVLGAFLTWISLKDGTLELALGIHAGNNLFAALVITFPESALPTPAIFYTTHFDPLYGLLVQLLACVLFYLIVFGWRKQPTPVKETPMATD
jgi:membrane protease YdiL (CAAX protease family)